jgi:hypothetical protein
MSYEDLEEARAKRVEKESTQEAKGQGKRGRKRKSGTPEADEGTADTARRGRKRKSATLEGDTPEPSAKVVRISQAPEPARATGAQMSETQVVEDESVPKPFRAPVARMW